MMSLIILICYGSLLMFQISAQSVSLRALGDADVSTCEEGSSGSDVLILGDSWGTWSAMWGTFEDMLKSICPSVQVAEVTALSLEATELKEKLGTCKEGDPFMKLNGVSLIWLSIGGNELLGRCKHDDLLASGLDEVMSLALNATEQIISRILDASPKVQIIIHGYDFLGNSTIKSSKCLQSYIKCADPEQLEIRTAEDGKRYFRVYQDELLSLSAKYERVQMVDWWGSFERVLEAHMVDSPEASPDDLMLDCMHPSSIAFQGMFQEVKEAWTGFLTDSVTGCSAVTTVDPPPASADEADTPASHATSGMRHVVALLSLLFWHCKVSVTQVH
eukprot:gnl/MRDRNA2_/MRDRNA2_107868_c0_seq1.p1 gnl/MRDRNA2_/MRDRNA2_107868_c0~~gnl/MRDRNA2_/MRDRNA2_107868_c0_seq1.p1  ORF type:complete len:332 (-),score=50.41 gnl/MRDRNA2_/MRDRNA2_107868_c0_seq1:405-1400(-)